MTRSESISLKQPPGSVTRGAGDAPSEAGGGLGERERTLQCIRTNITESSSPSLRERGTNL